VTRPLRHGEPWGRAATGPPDVEVTGDDADLAAAAARHPGALVRFRPGPRSDLARALGLGPDATGTTEVAIDTLALDPDGNGGAGTVDAVDAVTAVNTVVLGPAPDRLRRTSRAADITVHLDGRPWFAGRATTVVVANGQFLRRADLVPRGHPGDGRAEVQVYALARRERGGMRRRLPTGTHVPHPRIAGGRARRVEVEVAGRRLPVEIDGHERGRTARLVVTLVPAAIRMLI
jgi:YegS C-terminal NAD kinase beta sandwich-like domain